MLAYSAYNLHIQSELPLPDLIPASSDSLDVVVHYGDVPTHLSHPLGIGGAYQGSPGRFLLSIPDIARYLVIDGREVRIDPAPASTDDDVRTFLLGSALGALLHQRHILALHASCVQTPRGAVLFAGRSGDGKSTLLAALMQRGYAMLADDVTGVTLDDTGIAIALPAFPCTRLWADVATKLKYPLARGRRLRLPLEKYVMPAPAFCAKSLPVYAIYCLTPHSQADIRLESVEHLERFEQIAACTYRPRFLDALDVRQSHFHRVLEMAHAVQVRRVKRPLHSFLLDELVDSIEAEIN